MLSVVSIVLSHVHVICPAICHATFHHISCASVNCYLSCSCHLSCPDCAFIGECGPLVLKTIMTRDRTNQKETTHTEPILANSSVEDTVRTTVLNLHGVDITACLPLTASLRTIRHKMTTVTSLLGEFIETVTTVIRCETDTQSATSGAHPRKKSHLII